MPDELTTRLVQAAPLLHLDAGVSRDQLISAWTASTDPVVRCRIAHQIADLCTDPADDLAWNERALAAAEAAPQSRVVALYPSLHLNLAASCLRLGDVRSARGHLERAQACQSALGDDPYAEMIRGGIARLWTKIGPEPGRPERGSRPN